MLSFMAIVACLNLRMSMWCLDSQDAVQVFSSFQKQSMVWQILPVLIIILSPLISIETALKTWLWYEQEMLLGRRPTEMKDVEKLTDNSTGLSEEALDLLTSLLVEDPEKRINLEQMKVSLQFWQQLHRISWLHVFDYVDTHWRYLRSQNAISVFHILQWLNRSMMCCGHFMASLKKCDVSHGCHDSSEE